MNIDSAPVYLRSLELDDLDRIHKWHNDPGLYRTLTGAYRPVSRATVEEWLHSKIQYSTQEENFAICLKSTAQHIGNTYLRDIDWVSRKANALSFIGEPSERSKGYGTTTRQLLLKHAFKDLGLKRIYVHVLTENIASVKMNNKCGLVIEGTLRRHAFKDGKYKDVYVMGILADEYFAAEDQRESE